MESKFINIAERRIQNSVKQLRQSSKYAAVAGLSSYKDIFQVIFWNSPNILLVEQLRLPLSSLIFFLETFSSLFEAMSLALWQKLIFENMNSVFSQNSYLNPNLGGLFRVSFCGWGDYFLSQTRQSYVKNLKFGMLVHTHMQFHRICLLVLRPLKFADVSIFLQKCQHFWQKQYLYSKQQYESFYRDFPFPILVFVR